MEQEHQDFRRVPREIASVMVISADGLYLMGKKRSGRGSSFEDLWHMFGGGVEPGETLEQAAVREVLEEADLDLSGYELELLDSPDELSGGERVKTLETGERIIDEMHYNRFEVRLDKDANDVELPESTDEMEEIRWFTGEELKSIHQIPGGKEYFEYLGYIKTR